MYVAREKVQGAPHHAKAGNINSALLKEGPSRGDYVLVLDCDFIVSPDFLRTTMGHFYERAPDGAEGVNGWRLKPKASFLQTPQDFYNLDAYDQLAHGGRLFYGPLQQGRDGAGAVCCCGSNVIFSRAHLVSIGGQAYGSITEDNFTAMKLTAAGFSSMYLDRRLAFGLAPDDVEGTFGQKLRWTQGALQIYWRANPLRQPGMSALQRLLFFDSATYCATAPIMVVFAIAPAIFVLSDGVSPFAVHALSELCAVFGVAFVLMQFTLWWAHRGTPGGLLEMWRTTQMAFWLAPNHIKAMCKVLVSEVGWLKRLCGLELGFNVTAKNAKEEDAYWVALRATLRAVWPHLTYYFIVFVATIMYIVYVIDVPLDRSLRGGEHAWNALVSMAALLWCYLSCIYLWPPVGTLIPPSWHCRRQEGWEVEWGPSGRWSGPPPPQDIMVDLHISDKSQGASCVVLCLHCV